MSRLVNKHRDTGKYYYLGNEQDMLAKMYKLEELVTPKQPTKTPERINTFDCPGCKETITYNKYSNCRKCGQKLDWINIKFE